MLTPRYESRKHAVKDGSIQKPGGLGYTNRHYTGPGEKERLLNPSYMYEGNKASSFSASREYEEVYKEAKPKERREKHLCPHKATVKIPEKPLDQIQQKPKWVSPEDKSQGMPKEKKDKSQSVAALTRPLRYTELSPLMTEMVKDELTNIMINVWHTLPDAATNEADKLVIDKFKDTAGDDLRNTIGLNVTKRLLNVNNGILVKIKLHSPVPSADVYVFANKYGITDIQDIQTQIYAGRIQSWTDLDELYSMKNLKCGKTGVTVTPVYQFMKCPPSLRTIFDGSQDYSKAKSREKEAATKMKKLEGKVIVTADKVLAQEAMKDLKPKTVVKSKKTESASKNETEPAKKVEVSKNTELKSKVTTVGNKETEQPKSVIKTETKAIEPTKTVNKPAVAASTVTKDIKTKNQMTKVQPAKPVVNKPSVVGTAKNVATSKLNENKKPVVKAVNVTQTKTPAKEPTKPSVSDINKTVVKPQSNEVKKPQEKVFKELANVVTKEPVKVVSKKPAKEVSDEKPAKIALKEPGQIVAKEPAKVVLKEPTDMVAKVVTKEQANVVATKPVATNTPKKETAKPKLTETKKPVIKATTVVPTKMAVKEKPKTPVKVGNKNNVDSKPPKKNENDFDELNDRDILSMLTSGIVLDECCGSDED